MPTARVLGAGLLQQPKRTRYGGRRRRLTRSLMLLATALSIIAFVLWTRAPFSNSDSDAQDILFELVHVRHDHSRHSSALLNSNNKNDMSASSTAAQSSSSSPSAQGSLASSSVNDAAVSYHPVWQKAASWRSHPGRMRFLPRFHPRVIVSVSASLDRIDALAQTLALLDKQSRFYDSVYVFLPLQDAGQAAVSSPLPAQLKQLELDIGGLATLFPNVHFFACKDFGPATMLLCALEIEHRDRDTLILTIGGADAIAPDLIKRMALSADRQSYSAVGMVCNTVLGDASRFEVGGYASRTCQAEEDRIKRHTQTDSPVCSFASVCLIWMSLALASPGTAPLSCGVSDAHIAKYLAARGYGGYVLGAAIPEHGAKAKTPTSKMDLDLFIAEDSANNGVNK
ncbi:hypothetical protein BC831DRAFT_449659 [Entophlyctis helioformis]|nr:hypothetical protein BC831DRAFT_449659 [Entophlyctis helioformis]